MSIQPLGEWSLRAQDGRQARAALYHATPPLPGTPGAQLGWFMEMIFGGHDKPDMFAVATLKGLYETEHGARNDFVWAEIDGQVVSTVWTITPAEDPRLGSLGEVFTDPSARGLGLARHTCRAILDLFDERGGQCMYLSTDNPTAARIYEGLGFAPHPGGVMRRVNTHAPDFDSRWFAPSPGQMAIREIRWGDMPRLAALYTAPSDWVSVCFPQGFFSACRVSHHRCNSFIKHTYQATRRGLWLGLFNAEGAMVGSCPVYPRGNERELNGGEIDLFAHPAFAEIGQIGPLLEVAIAALRARGWRWLMAHVPAEDQAKRAILEAVGHFRQIAALPDALVIDGAAQEVHVLHTLL